ncbi:MAG TPA: phosphoethanolamine transferase [Bacteriovoracaceae bacterium]|nr:phosphoethanolamine transferase [Bacteriovoracaceae bacterium]
MSLILYFLILISPSIMYYMKNAQFSVFLPFFILSQLSGLFLLVLLLKRRILIYSFTFIFLASAIAHWGHYSLYEYELTAGAVASILSTNPSEVFEFFLIIPKMFWVLLVMVLLGFVFLIKKTPQIIPINFKHGLIFIGIVLFSFCLKFFSTKSLSQSFEDLVLKSQPLKTVLSFGEAIQLLQDFSSKLSNMQPLSLNAKNLSSDDEQVHIVLIGESARRKSWNLYGYIRETNKYTKEHADLFIFKDVVSAANATIQSISQTLTQIENDKMANLLDTAESAGFKTYWLSNQAQFGIFNNPTTAIASHAMVRQFVNTDSSTTSFDEMLLANFQRALMDNARKKLIILHLMGSHFYYDRRYPKKFDVFNDEKILQMHSYQTKNANVINAYDNSILYTDYVVSKVISLTKGQGKLASVLYFSDHGENLFDYDDQYGHGGMDVKKIEVEVPMMLWLSDSFIPVLDDFSNMSLLKALLACHNPLHGKVP